MTGRPCIICGDENTEQCHVKAKRSFSDAAIESGDDRIENIVRLCPTHHELMDDGRIAIGPDRETAKIWQAGEVRVDELRYMPNVDDEYIRWRNQYSDFVNPF